MFNKPLNGISIKNKASVRKGKRERKIYTEKEIDREGERRINI